MITERDDDGRIASRSIAERFAERIAEPQDPHNDCWIWTGSKTGSGYGQIWLNGKDRKCAHVFAYEMYVGPVPEGHHVDHMCAVRACVRPDHLQAIPRKENVSQWNVLKTHCPAGHPYDEENTYAIRGERQCRICRREAVRRYQARKER